MSRVGSVATLTVMTASAGLTNAAARALDIQPSSGPASVQITSCFVFSVKSANRTYDCTTEARKAVQACNPTQACEISIGYNLTQGKDIDPGTGFLGKRYASVSWGLFLAYAAEVGDEDAADKMLDYAQRNYKSVGENGEYYYPRSDDFSVDAKGNSHGVDPWTGNVFIPMARLNKGGGFYALYNHPWGESQYRRAHISDIDALSTNVSQAFYDEAKDALIVTLEPGPIAARQIHFTVRQLDPAKTYSVSKNGKLVGRLERNGVSHNESMQWREDGTVVIATGIATPQTYVIVGKRSGVL